MVHKQGGRGWLKGQRQVSGTIVERGPKEEVSKQEGMGDTLLTVPLLSDCPSNRMKAHAMKEMKPQ